MELLIITWFLSATFAVLYGIFGNVKDGSNRIATSSDEKLTNLWAFSWFITVLLGVFLLSHLLHFLF